VTAGPESRLASADWLIDPDTQRLMGLLDGEAGRTRAVGGIVRDTVLGLPLVHQDIDLATELLPETVMQRAAAAGIAAYPTGIEHGTVTLRSGSRMAEVTTLREDVETDGRHAVVRFGSDWQQDAARRDFTLNALYCGMDGGLFDPLGGLADCLAGRVRFIGDADRRIAEDRLRVLRFFRFSASHGGERFDADGLAAAARAARRLDTVSAERVGAEMRRMLGLARIAITLKTMSEAGIVMVGRDSIDMIHSYERRTFRPNFLSRLALILVETDPNGLKRDWRLANDDLLIAERLLAAARLLCEFRLHEAAYRYPASLADSLEIAATLSGWTNAGRQAVLDQLQGLEVPRMPIKGTDLIAHGFSPGRVLGEELARLERLWIESGFRLDREALLGRANSQR
jgi:poly(A) polymerase